VLRCVAFRFAFAVAIPGTYECEASDFGFWVSKGGRFVRTGCVLAAYLLRNCRRAEPENPGPERTYRPASANNAEGEIRKQFAILTRLIIAKLCSPRSMPPT
jgi:hypothetical protein